MAEIASASLYQETARTCVESILAGTRLVVEALRDGKVLLCGNGGSAADCQHIAAEFTNRSGGVPILHVGPKGVYQDGDGAVVRHDPAGTITFSPPK